MRRNLQGGVDLLQRLVDVTREAGWQAQAHARRNAALLRGGPVDTKTTTTLYWPTNYDAEYTPRWAEHFRRGLSERGHLELTALPQPFENIIRFDLQLGGVRVPLALDYRDSSELDAS